MTLYLDQISRKAQLISALNPDNIQIDGRSVRDRLSFAAHFSELILFYNQQNQQSGTWQPFLLKDPVILLAVISKTDHASFYNEYSRLAAKLVDYTNLPKLSSLKNKVSLPAESDLDNPLTATIIAPYAVPINQIFNLIWQMFVHLNRWVVAMGPDRSSYYLRDYVHKKISDSMAAVLGQVVALQQYLALASQSNPSQEQIQPIDRDLYQKFSPIWQKARVDINVEQWQCPGQDPTSNDDKTDNNTDDTPPQTLGTLIWFLKYFYDQVFGFFLQVIDSAGQAYDGQLQQPSDYPDTALLVAFCKLMESQQQSLNQYSRKHLDFYYQQVLQQSLAPAKADQAFVCLTLADNINSYELPAGTELTAGSYPDKSDILFSTTETAELNRAVVAISDTLNYSAPSDKEPGLYLTQMKNINQLKRDKMQQVISWDAFGNKQGAQRQQGFAFASPMLFLQNGERTITLTFEFIESLPENYFNHCQLFFSTKSGWFEKALPQVADATLKRNITLSIALTSGDPAITAFVKNPDGYNSQWPLLKFVLDPNTDLTVPPQLKKVTMKCIVSECSEFTLGNDNAILPNKGSAFLLGPVPEQGSYFYLGSNECFAKPLSALSLKISWENLPTDFRDYYQQYNDFINSQRKKNTDPDALSAALKYLDNALESLKEAVQEIDKLQVNISNRIDILEKNENDTVEQKTILSKATQSISTTIKNVSKLEGNIAGINKNLESVKSKFQTVKESGAITEKSYQCYEAVLNSIANDLDDTNLTEISKILNDVKSKYVKWCPLRSTINKNDIVTVLNQFKSCNILIRSEQTYLLACKIALLPLSLEILRTISNKSFKGKWSLLTNGTWQPILAEPASLESTEVVDLFQQDTNGDNLQSSTFSFSCSQDDLLENGVAELTQAPLIEYGKAKNAYLKFELTAPGYAFGHDLYGKVVSAISLENAEVLMGKNKILDFLTRSSPKQLQPMPNLPYSPKKVQVRVSYTASTECDITPSKSSLTNYPLTIFHYGSYQPYSVYDSQESESTSERDSMLGFVNLVPGKALIREPNKTSTKTVEPTKTVNLTKTLEPNKVPTKTVSTVKKGIPLFTGVGGQGCFYLGFTDVLAPCTLSIFIEVTQIFDSTELNESSVGYYYWGDTKTTKEEVMGWQPITVLENKTNNLNCSGIIKFDLPQLSEAKLRKIQKVQQDLTYIPCPVMPLQDGKKLFWLAIATKQDNIKLKFSYLNTQAVKVIRSDLSSLSQGEIPQVQANAITASKIKIPQLSEIAQPFASFSGLAAEDQEKFYWRVSDRIHTKDRVSSRNNYEQMAHNADSQLFYARLLTADEPTNSKEKKHPGRLSLGLVSSVINSQEANAFRPLVSVCQQTAIDKYIKQRVSAMASIQLFNLKQQIITIHTQLTITEDANANALSAELNQQLKVYLSPWIASEQAQVSITKGVDRSGVINLLTRSDQVVGVSRLTIFRTPLTGKDTTPVSVPSETVTANQTDAILVSADHHAISLSWATKDSSNSEAEPKPLVEVVI